MLSYSPAIELYYLKHDTPLITGVNRLVPAPQLSITPEYYYANDVMIGYTYNITLDGYATSIDRSKNLVPALSSGFGFNEVMNSIQDINNIFNSNGGSLLAVNSAGNTVFQANGAIVRGVSFAETDNLWVNYAKYSVNLECNDIFIADCSGAVALPNCGILPSGIIETPALIDMKEHKVKSFNDSWSFEIGDTTYNSYTFSESSGNFRNDYFTVTYNINAVGKHYIKYDSGETTQIGLIPAWEQAKNFVQSRLSQQVSGLITNVLYRNSTNNNCIPYSALSGLFDKNAAGAVGLLDQLTEGDYKVYNEKISCQTSEAEGSFSATYTAIIKRYEIDPLSDPDSLHTFSVTRNVEDDGINRTISISVDGNIQGLLEGGLIRPSGNPQGVLKLPYQGQILLITDSGVCKYDKALTAYNKIGTKTKLNDNFAKLLGITYGDLGITGAYNVCRPSGDVPINTSHTLTHNYNEGSINYKSSYDSNRACNYGLPYKNISVTVDDPVPIIAEFVVPGRSGGPIIQKIGVDKPKRISITIEGAQPLSGIMCCPDFEQLLGNNCLYDLSVSGVGSGPIAGLKITENKFTANNDGSFSFNRSYICCG